MLNVRGPKTGGYKYSEFDTSRFDSQNREKSGEFLGAGYYNSAIQKYPQSAPQETEKDAILGRSNGPGPVAPVITKNSMYCTNAQLLKESKRASYDEVPYVPGPQRTDALLLAKLGYQVSPYMSQHHKFKVQNKFTENRHLSHAQSPYLYNHSTSVGGDASNGKKITGETNPRLDFSIAKTVLQGNPYTITPS
jgi:hypothetical protein